LIVAGVRADDGALDSHRGRGSRRDAKPQRAEFNWISLLKAS
jgi:hypothetical protein